MKKLILILALCVSLQAQAGPFLQVRSTLFNRDTIKYVETYEYKKILTTYYCLSVKVQGNFFEITYRYSTKRERDKQYAIIRKWLAEKEN